MRSESDRVPAAGTRWDSVRKWLKLGDAREIDGVSARPLVAESDPAPPLFMAGTRWDSVGLSV